MVKFERYTKYEVMKLDDIEKYLPNEMKEWLHVIIETIQEGREKDNKVPCNHYVVINEDEPYAEKVWALIQEQWEKENNDY